LEEDEGLVSGKFLSSLGGRSMFELSENQIKNAMIKVIGIGGGGGNAVNHMIEEGVWESVEFISANTDVQALKNSRAKVLLQLGSEITKGLGAGANPEMGRLAAEENRDRLRDILSGADMVFITCGMGGGTGTGGAPIVAQIAKELGILTVAIVTKPFAFEGKKRMLIADSGIKELSRSVDSLITIPNDKLLAVLGKNISLLNAFKAANNVLLGAVQGIADLITRPGLINVDFADVRAVMSETGMAMMGSGVSSGEYRAREASEAAISSPLLEDVDLTGACGVLVNITAGLNMSIGEFEEVGEVIKSFTSENATVVVGTVIDPEMNEDLRVTVVVTGLGRHNKVGTGSNAHTPAINTEEIKIESPEIIKPDNSVDYDSLEKPAVMRKQAQDQIQGSLEIDRNMDYLDIPAFLRRKNEDFNSREE
jgi:cell division protein FtsZ